MKEAQELVKLAKAVMADDVVKVASNSEDNPLNGMRKNKATDLINTIMNKYSRGFFTDDYWKPVQKIFKEFSKNDLPWSITKTRYDKDDNGNPKTKHWWIEIPFENERGREHTIYVKIVADGAGPIDDPLSRYDLAAYAS